jgi:glucan phosphoethanolaminetransferase (alkaline phosphatase superfamily)
MSVDDVIADVIAACEELTTPTYFFYSSDHGFQLGGRHSVHPLSLLPLPPSPFCLSPSPFCL